MSYSRQMEISFLSRGARTAGSWGSRSYARRIVPDILALSLNGTHCLGHFFQLGYHIQHAIVDTVKVPIINLSSLPREHNIPFCLLVQIAIINIFFCRLLLCTDGRSLGLLFTTARITTSFCWRLTLLLPGLGATNHLVRFTASPRLRELQLFLP